uniref:Uncharacterized protein n=1 Tax=Arundo donax TaxID=35708 RepID=A0A0A9DSP6_ARUDO
MISDQRRILLSLKPNTPLVFCWILQTQKKCYRDRSKYLKTVKLSSEVSDK